MRVLQSYEALPSEPHINDEQQQAPGQAAAAAAGGSNTARPAVLFQGPDLHPVRDVPGMSLELQQMRSKAVSADVEGAAARER